MKHLLLTTIAAVLVVGCGPSVDIWTAAEQGDIKAVKQHLDAGTDVNAKDKYGRTPLDEAARKGHKEIAKLLIAEGADVNAMDDDGDTPLDRVHAIRNQQNGNRRPPAQTRRQDWCRTLNSQSCRSRKHRSRQKALD